MFESNFKKASNSWKLLAASAKANICLNTMFKCLSDSLIVVLNMTLENHKEKELP